MAKESLRTAKSEPGFQSFVLVIHHSEKGLARMPIRPRSWCFLRIDEIRAKVPEDQHIPIYNRPPLERDRKKNYWVLRFLWFLVSKITSDQKLVFFDNVQHKRIDKDGSF